ncbi:MAG: rhomboid family intramembrane serine protease [Myxococcales bacterium]|nr:rhomboid family intramembrane serine protease [Myxococcales bacterium]
MRTETGDEDLDLPELELRIRKGEVSPQSLVRFPAVTGESFVPACELEIFRALQEPKRAHFARAFSLGRFPWITSALIFANLAAYLLSIRGGPLDIDGMVRFGGKAGPLVTDLGEVWRLLTANFLHRDALHVGLNMFVFLIVGGALENAYRALDYVFLLLFSGLATMTVSLFLSDAVSVGASGMVYGCLGGVVVFGLKYRSILPSRYRRVMGEAAIPTVLGLLLIGVTSPGVDNWAHLGGLWAGIFCALFLRPKLLADAPRAWWSPALRALPSLAAVFCVAFGDGVFAGWLPLMREVRDDGFGISMPVPRDWQRRANRLGQLAYSNGLPGVGRASFYAAAVEAGEPADVASQAARFIEEGLLPTALGPEVLQVTASPLEPTRVAERDALLVQARLQEPFGATRLLAYFVPRGQLVYQLVFRYPEDFPRYARVVDQMVAGARFVEPRAVRQARARALLFPNASWSMGQLGEVLRRQGEPFAAAEALRPAVRADPSNPALRRELALALLQSGETDEACAAARAAVLYAPGDPSSLEVEARCELQRGNLRAALSIVLRARQLAPADRRLQEAEAKLRAALGAER